MKACRFYVGALNKEKALVGAPPVTVNIREGSLTALLLFNKSKSMSFN